MKSVRTTATAYKTDEQTNKNHTNRHTHTFIGQIKLLEIIKPGALDLIWRVTVLWDREPKILELFTSHHRFSHLPDGMTPFYSIGSLYRRPGRVRDQGDRLILTRFAVGVCVRIWGVFGRESHNRPVPLSVRDEHSREQRAHTHSAAHAVVGKLPQLPLSCRLDQINRVNEHQR